MPALSLTPPSEESGKVDLESQLVDSNLLMTLTFCSLLFTCR